MTRSARTTHPSFTASARAVIVATLVVTAFVGCWQGTDEDGTANGTGGRSDAGGPTDAERSIAEKPLFDGWNDPEAVIVVSGEQLGHLEPCGCAPETLAGGVGRRDDLMRMIRDRDWPVTAVDLGSTVRRSRPQSAIKFDTILAAYKDMGYAALGLGTRELNIGPDYLLVKQSEGPESPTYVPFLSSNVTFFGDPEFPGGPGQFTTTQLGDRRIAITSIVEDDEVHPELQESDLLTVAGAEAALAATMPKIEAAEPDFRVLLAHTDEERARELIARFPSFDLVVCTGPEEPSSEPIVIGETLLVSVGGKGKYVGVIGLFDDAERPVRYELVHLDRFRFQETERMHERLREYQERLRSEGVAGEGEPARHPREAEFVGAKTCGECHTKAYAKWSTSRHARATESLIHGHDPEKEGYPRSEHEWINRIHDPECLACHVTGWDPENVLRYESGFLNAEFARNDAERQLESRLSGQQCENCHGPGSRHVELERLWKRDPASVPDDALRAARGEMDLMVVLDPRTGRPAKAVRRNENERNLCYSCHDQDNSPKFEFADYWEKVRHPGKD